jgi:16S rRNA (adenine1518-N6/adenine1519-N6)-dimethyltransferase
MMIQKEVGDRFSAKPGSKAYSSITVFLNYYYNIKKMFNVNRNEFIPVPNVDSVVVSLTLKDEREFLKNESHFFELVRDSFKFKRKTIKNNLKNYDLTKIEQVLKNNGFGLETRAEHIPLDVFVEISNAL